MRTYLVFYNPHSTKGERLGGSGKIKKDLQSLGYLFVKKIDKADVEKELLKNGYSLIGEASEEEIAQMKQVAVPGESVMVSLGGLSKIEMKVTKFDEHAVEGKIVGYEKEYNYRIPFSDIDLV